MGVMISRPSFLFKGLTPTRAPTCLGLAPNGNAVSEFDVPYLQRNPLYRKD